MYEVTYDSVGEEISRRASHDVQIEKLTSQVSQLEDRLRDQTEAIQGDTRDSILMCKVCFAKHISRVLRPCNHACMCEACEAKLRSSSASASHSRRIKCPMCRTLCHRSEEIILS